MYLPIFANPKSRSHLRNPGLTGSYEEAGRGRIVVFKPVSFDELDDCARRCREKGYRAVAISGGDGTIHQVITALIRAYDNDPLPGILLLGDGTMNNIANSVGIKRGSKKIIQRYIDETIPEAVQVRSTIHIDNRYCFLFGCGLISNFLIEVYRGKKGLIQNCRVIRMSVTEALRSIVIKEEDALKLLKPLDAEIFVEGEKLPLEHIVALLAGTVEKIGMGFRPLSKAVHTEGHYHLIASGVPPAKTLLNIAPIALGKGLFFPDNRYVDTVTKNFEIRAKAPFEYTMDGDMYTCEGVLTVTTGPNVNFILT